MQTRFMQRIQLPDVLITPNAATRNSWLLTAVFSLLFLLWLAYRLVGQPGWAENLPALLAELLWLLEMGAAVTLGLVWATLWWRRLQHRRAIPVVDLATLYTLSPGNFEEYVGDLFRRKGYRVKRRGRSGDLGVDLEVTQRNGRRAIVQCKRYRHTVGAEVVRELFGVLIHERAAHGFLVTTAEISDAAREWATDKPLSLIDGQALVDIAAALQAKEAD